jgi:formate dehydrogenase maturation protein FdhE
MLWPQALLRRPRNVDVERRVAEVRRDQPEAEAWLGILEAALAESENGGAWDATVPRPLPPPGRPVRAPLLYRAHITLDEGQIRKWVRHLAAAARAHVGPVDGTTLFAAGVRQDDLESPALRVVAQMAVLPFFHACARMLANELPVSWWEGYCPLCGAWPLLSEYVGLERKRQLRCGRCGTGWAIPLLRCVFCDQTDHEQLGYLTPEGTGEDMRKVEVCHSCKGYLKGLATVRALAPGAILLDDLSTVYLDVVALERGYVRPERPGYALEVQLS